MLLGFVPVLVPMPMLVPVLVLVPVPVLVLLPALTKYFLRISAMFSIWAGIVPKSATCKGKV